MPVRSFAYENKRTISNEGIQIHLGIFQLKMNWMKKLNKNEAEATDKRKNESQGKKGQIKYDRNNIPQKLLPD